MSQENQTIDTELFQQIWQDQQPPDHGAQDISHPCPLSVSGPIGDAGDCSPDQVAEDLRQALGWPKWVHLAAKPAMTMLALNRMARDMGLERGIMWVAPGTGAPLITPQASPGVAVLRADWAPDAHSMQEAQTLARERGWLVALDESATGFRLARGGAMEAMDLSPDAAIYGPGLTRTNPLAVLAGKGPEPAKPKPPPAAAIAELSANIARLADPALAPSLAKLGAQWVAGLRFFIKTTGLFEEVTVEGPPVMPRLAGRRVWAFMELAREEGLSLGPVVMINDSLDHGGLRPALTRVARALARLKVLPIGEKAPLGWRDASLPTSCAAVDQMLANIED